KSEGKDAKGAPTQTYDVRHILIGTTIADPENPMARPMPIAQKVRTQLEEEKQKQVLDEIVKNNPVEVPEDFNVPEPTKEQMDQMMKQQQQQMQQMQQMQGGGKPGMPPGAGADEDEDAPPPPSAKAPVKPQPKK
ncbi:MAG: hypothetical protein ABIP06_08035, partial [Pyrinomonadaceae bacterium]